MLLEPPQSLLQLLADSPLSHVPLPHTGPLLPPQYLS
jgi:hypothetical protein